eukprot:5481970-Pyramimonas_sp.AAC.1
MKLDQLGLRRIEPLGSGLHGPVQVKAVCLASLRRDEPQFLLVRPCQGESLRGDPLPHLRCANKAFQAEVHRRVRPRGR